MCNPSLLLLLLIASTFGQRLPVPRRQLLAPTVRFAESFESFDSDADEDDTEDSMQRTREQLRQLLGRQLSSAVAPLTAVPFAAGLIRRQPGIVAPSSGIEAAQRFASTPRDEQESSEEDDESNGSGSTETETDGGNAETDLDAEQQPVSEPAPQPQPQPEPEYNPYRDNFEDRNEDGSYVFGYSLPNGVRRWERSYLTQQGRVVEGFYAQPRQVGHGKAVEYELRCYRADAHGYHPLTVEYLALPPRVRRYELPSVRCLKR